MSSYFNYPGRGVDCTMKSLQCSIAQIRPVLGDIQKNLDKHMEFIEKAKRHKSNVLVFPELSLTGYTLQDLTYDVALTIDSQPIKQIISQSQEVDIIFSFVEEDATHSFYISAVYASKGRIAHVHRKVYLPTYGLFDEARYFDAGNRVQAFDTGNVKAGMLICEDAWHPSTAYILSTDGAHVIYVLAASPGRGMREGEIQSDAWWQTTIRSYAQLHGVFVVYANRVGIEDGLVFAGGSSIFDSEGEQIIKAAYLEEELITANLDFRKLRRSRIINPLMRNEKLEITLNELQRIAKSSYSNSLHENRQKGGGLL